MWYNNGRTPHDYRDVMLIISLCQLLVAVLDLILTHAAL